MSYLQHTLNETLRLYPSVAVNDRTALHNTTIPRGGGSGGLFPREETQYGGGKPNTGEDPSF